MRCSMGDAQIPHPLDTAISFPLGKECYRLMKKKKKAEIINTL